MMQFPIPTGARPASRVILLDEQGHVLYLHARDGQKGQEFWVMPGGGLQPSESFEAAALRELTEETGVDVSLGPAIWTRHHQYEWDGSAHNQFEVFFLATTNHFEIRPPQQDSYVFGSRWWSLSELLESHEQFSPTHIAELLGPILQGDLPREPFDCGV